MKITDKQIIEFHGGASKMCELLGWSKKGGVQRIHNWTLRGIPPREKLARPDLFQLTVVAPKPPRNS
jgi:hypothetical protein